MVRSYLIQLSMSAALVDSYSMHCRHLDVVLKTEAPQLLSQVVEHQISPAHVIDIGHHCGVAGLHQHGLTAEIVDT